MGDGGSNVSHVSFIVFRFRQSSFGLMFGICFADFLLMFWYMYINGCKYHHELSYKAPISGMVVSCHVVTMFWF